MKGEYKKKCSVLRLINTKRNRETIIFYHYLEVRYVLKEKVNLGRFTINLLNNNGIHLTDREYPFLYRSLITFFENY